MEEYVKIPSHTFYSLIDLIDIAISYIPDMVPSTKESLHRGLRDIIKEVKTTWEEEE